MYKRIFTEADDNDLNELVGELKGQFKTIKQVKGCTKFKKLSDADKEYLLDELKADGFKESVMREVDNNSIKKIVNKYVKLFVRGKLDEDKIVYNIINDLNISFTKDIDKIIKSSLSRLSSGSGESSIIGNLIWSIEQYIDSLPVKNETIKFAYIYGHTELYLYCNGNKVLASNSNNTPVALSSFGFNLNMGSQEIDRQIKKTCRTYYKSGWKKLKKELESLLGIQLDRIETDASYR